MTEPRHRSALALFSALAAGAILPAQESTPFQPFDAAAFEAHVAAELDASSAQLERYRAEAAELSPGVAADALLCQLVIAYGAAVELAEAAEPRAALSLAELLAQTQDPYVRAHARYHLGRVFLDGDDPEGAAEVFASYLRDDRSRCALDAEVMYFYGHSLAMIPAPADAATALRAFLDLFPQAPERYRASALQQLAELEAQGDSALHEIADVMKGVERRIRRTDTGEETQASQQQVMTQLAEIIEQIEQQEQQTAGSPSGLNRPNSPAGNSAAPPGETRIGNLGRNPGAADRWGDLADREREAIESELQTRLPGHYRRMLEEYYKKLGTGRE